MRNRIVATILSVAAIAAIAALIFGGAKNTPAQTANPNIQRMNGPVRQDGQPPSSDSDSRGQVFPEGSYLPEGQVFVGTSVQNDVSPALRDIRPIEPAPFTEVRTMEEYLGREEEAEGTGELEERQQIEDPVLQSGFFGNTKDSLFAMPGPMANFEGVNNRDGVYPPDTNMDVGPNHIVQWVNLSFQIFDKSGNSLYGPAEGNTLWSGFGGQCENNNDGDPIVLYDPMANRWLMSQFVASNPYGQCIAISTTADPTGSYYRYFFQLSTSVFYDYPHLGVWPDGYYMGANRFTSTYQGASAIVFDRAKMLNGQTATYQQFNTSTSYGTLLPADLDGTTQPPSGEPNFFLELGSTSLHLWKFKVNWATPSSSTFTGPTTLTVAAYNELCTTTQACIPQPSTSIKLDGLGDRLMHRVVYRNFGSYEALALSHSVNAASSGTQAGVRWYEIRNPNGTPSIYQQGTYSPDSNHRWMPSIAFDKQGNMALGYSVSSSSVYPSIRYTGRLSTDTLGQMPQGEATLVTGSGSQTGIGYRWGDYAMMAVDPSDDCTFWFTTEYVVTTGNANWQTRIGSFKFPSCGGPVNTPTPPPVATATPPAGQYCSSGSFSIPDNGSTTNAITISDARALQDMNVSINATHTYVGDLVFTLVHNATSVALIDRPGVPASTYGCNGDNIAATLDDEASLPVENQCASGSPTINGTFKPNALLSGFDGQAANGTWTLNVRDAASGDTGTVTQWCLIPSFGVLPSTPTPTAPVVFTRTPTPPVVFTRTPTPPVVFTRTPTPPASCPNASGGYCRTDNEARTWIAGSTNQSITGDDQVKAVTLPFSFTFAGTAYTSINVSSNGNAHFGSASSAYNNVTIPSSSAPNALIAALWDDLNPSAGGAIYTGVSGTAPNRTFVIEWRDVRRYGSGTSGATFEIQLVEGSNQVWILFQDTVFGNSSYDSGRSATCGVENAAGTAGNLYSYNTAVLTNNKVIHFWPQP